MSKLSPLFKKMIEESNNDPDVIKACETGTFYVEAIACLNGEYSLGCTELLDGTEMPILYPTREEAFKEIQEEIDRYAEEVKVGERDEDDEYEGELLVAKWDGESKMVSLYTETCESSPVHEGTWRSMAGLSEEKHFDFEESSLGM